ncbi:hypothetical protein ADN00_01790 [Ornatilinea apprima]|uniref:Uncharacterized protein n=1 Tax=Ornatilinea apprima TaxID=1134406 RepID=A0A0N8GPC0_9CHLR|nr:hypothetical protein ADN00_01790 [Ornatilinea apprima]
MEINLIIAGIFFVIIIEFMKRFQLTTTNNILVRVERKNDRKKVITISGWCYLQLIGVYWIVIGILLKILRLKFENIFLQALLLFLICGAPFVIGKYLLSKK